MNLLDYVAELAGKRVEKYGARYIAFGVFSLICFALPVYMWTVTTAGCRSVLTFRITAILLSFFLAVSDAWRDDLKKYLPLYWYVTITFCLPFFCMYLVILDGISLFWIVNIAITVILGMVLLDYVSFIAIFTFGYLMAFFCAFLLGHDVQNTNILNELIYPSCYLLFFVLVISVVFFKNKEQTQAEKIKAMKSLAGSIAHEMRTPIATIIMQLNLLKKNFQRSDKKEGLSSLERIRIMLNETNYINYIINITLARLREHNNDMFEEALPISEFVNYAVNRYPFGEGERKFVNVKILDDFELKADKNLMSQVLFNLIQNALQQIRLVHKGEIFITATQNRRRRILCVKDTTTGIKSKDLDNIFKPFVSNKKTGTGIGLYFCQSTIRAMKGSIRCESVYGEYTNFIIEF